MIPEFGSTEDFALERERERKREAVKLSQEYSVGDIFIPLSFKIFKDTLAHACGFDF